MGHKNPDRAFKKALVLKLETWKNMKKIDVLGSTEEDGTVLVMQLLDLHRPQTKIPRKVFF